MLDDIKEGVSAMPAKILIIEDEEKIARFMELELKHEGYLVFIEYNGRDGLEKINNENYDLILLDLMLPGIGGIDLCRKIRKSSDIPIIMVTARDGISDKVKGLDTGADDYITKPFAIEELLARIRSLLRRKDLKNEKDGQIISIDNLKIDLDKYIVTRNSEKIELTKKEYDLLVYLMKNKDIVLSREQILRQVWDYNYTGDTNIVDVYIRYLRAKIDELHDKSLIHTVRGVGYVLRVDEK